MAGKWTDRFLRIAAEVAAWSKDPRTKVGAVAVIARRIVGTGYNGLPEGVRDLIERMLPPDKYRWTCHAEANLVATAARSVLAGATVYVTHHPCSQCAALLIQAGVKRVIVGSGQTNMPPEEFEISAIMFREAEIMCEHTTELNVPKMGD